MLLAIDHVQLAMPAGGEAAARGFYGDVLGLPETPKPPHLAKRGGCWFESEALKIHLGVEADFRPARKAHPGLLVSELDALKARLAQAGYALKDDEPLEGYDRVYVDDPFGNRIELLERLSGGREVERRNGVIQQGVFDLDQEVRDWTQDGAFLGADGKPVRAYDDVVLLRDIAPENDPASPYVVPAGTTATVLFFSERAEGVAQLELNWDTTAVVLGYEDQRYLRLLEQVSGEGET